MFSDCQGPSIETPKLYEYILLSDHGICIGNPVTDSVNFKVNARSDAHIALMSSNSDHDPIYEIIIGGWANSRSIIRDSKEGLPLAMHHGPILKQNMYKTFNISWSHGNIRVKDGSKATIMEWTDTSSPLKIRNIGISTWWGSTGNWSFPCQGTNVLFCRASCKRGDNIHFCDLGCPADLSISLCMKP